jgi:8-oxo-dGTP pyrophosphatase MutT (NUDIX family)
MGAANPIAALAHDAIVAALRERLAGRVPRRVEVAGARAAAVAVLLVERDGRTNVLLTVRSAELRQHSGQIALPGGVCDDGDISFAATAQRESREELGIDPARLEVLGVLDDVPTPTGFVITPVVAILAPAPGTEYTPNPREVSGVFEAPLALFADRAAAEILGEREFQGARYVLRAYQHETYKIWGATARILEHLADLVVTTLDPDPR